MYEDFAIKMARVLTEYSVPIRKGNLVIINCNTEVIPLIEPLFECILQRDGHPMLNMSLPGLDELGLTLASDEQLTYINPVRKATVENVDVYINLHAPVNTRSLASTDPSRLQKIQVANRPLRDIYLERERRGDLRWVIAPWPTHAGAQQADMGLLAYRKFVYEACGLDRDDPVAYWQGFKDRQTRIVEWLDAKNEFQVKGPGIDISFSAEGRSWVSCHGDNNFPDGEVFTSPVEQSVNGQVQYGYPTYYGGREVTGVSLTFKDGKVVEASAQKGEDFLHSQLDVDGGSRYLGEFAIGTNFGIQQVTGSTLFDEKIGGTIHMALGQSFHEANGTNTSSVHWDMVHPMQNGGEIYADGELFYQNGKFLLEV